LSKEDQVT